MPSNTSPEIDSELKQALGNKSPSEVWQEIIGAVQAFSVEHPGAWDSEAEWWSHMEPYDALEALQNADPVIALALFHEIHPTLDLQNLQRLDDSLLAEAAAPNLQRVTSPVIPRFRSNCETANRSN